MSPRVVSAVARDAVQPAPEPPAPVAAAGRRPRRFPFLLSNGRKPAPSDAGGDALACRVMPLLLDARESSGARLAEFSTYEASRQPNHSFSAGVCYWQWLSRLSWHAGRSVPLGRVVPELTHIRRGPCFPAEVAAENRTVSVDSSMFQQNYAFLFRFSSLLNDRCAAAERSDSRVADLLTGVFGASSLGAMLRCTPLAS